MIEIWKPVTNCAGAYEVSNLGKVRRTNTKKLMTLRFGENQWRVSLMKLILESFTDMPFNTPFSLVTFLDGDRKNVNLRNLQWSGMVDTEAVEVWAPIKEVSGNYLVSYKHPKNIESS